MSATFKQVIEHISLRAVFWILQVLNWIRDVYSPLLLEAATICEIKIFSIDRQWSSIVYDVQSHKFSPLTFNTSRKPRVYLITSVTRA